MIKRKVRYKKGRKTQDSFAVAVLHTALEPTWNEEESGHQCCLVTHLQPPSPRQSFCQEESLRSLDFYRRYLLQTPSGTTESPRHPVALPDSQEYLDFTIPSEVVK